MCDYSGRVMKQNIYNMKVPDNIWEVREIGEKKR